MMFKRPWSDGLNAALGIEDYRDPFEIKFGLFMGGDDNGGGGSDEDVDQDEQQDIAASNYGLSNDDFDYSPGGVEGPRSSGGTTFGVDGVSKTGSTAQDAAIGYTSAPGSGLPGSNFGSLQDATAEQMSVVNSVASRAQNQGLNSDQTQAAIKSALDNYSTGSVTRSGNLTDKGQTAVQAALDAAAQPSAAQRAVDNILGGQTFGPFPSDQPQQNFVYSPPPQADVSLNVTSRPDIPANAQNMSNLILSRRVGSPAAFGVDTNIAMTALQDRALQGDTQAQDLLDEAANRGDITQAQADYARGFTTQGSAPAAPVGVAVAPTATAEAVLRGPDQVIAEQRAAGITSLAPSTTAQDMPIGRSMGGANELFGGTSRELSPLEQMIQGAVATSTRTPEEQAGVTPTGPMGAKAAAGTPAENFYADAYAELNPDIGTAPGTGIFEITNAIAGMSPLGLLTGTTSDLPSAADQAAFQSGQLLSLGGTMDPETGAISGAKAGRGELNMNRFGMVTYTGMPDPNYTGPFANLVNPQQDQGGDGGSPMTTDIAQPDVDPCPPGFQMVNGTCQPIQQPAAPGSNFVVNPTTGLPTAFTPFTQATQVGAINPFVLQPYAPGQNPFQQPVTQGGIQGVSPTGAALGRQI